METARTLHNVEEKHTPLSTNNCKCGVAAAAESRVCVSCLPACQQSVDRTHQCALSCPHAAGAGWVAEKAAGRGGQRWQGAVWSGNRSL